MTLTVFVVCLLSATAGVLAQGGDKRISIDPCSEYCLNGGTCVNQTTGPTCFCPREFSGTKCEIHPGTCPQPGDVSVCGGVPCETDVQCEYGQKCCELGCGGKSCTPVVTRDPCLPDPFVCKNGGTCTSPADAIICQCKSGFGGDRCEKRVPVKIGTCDDFARFREFNCTRGCDKDFDCPDTQKCCITRCEPQCTNRITINQCGGYCLNGGTCSDPGNGPTCSCPPGFSGTNCEIHPGTCPIVQPGDGSVCDGVPCATDVQCEYGQKCCELGCGGKSCTPVPTRNPCIPDPFVCKNGGTCTSPLDTIICQCKSGFGGDRCENRVPVKIGTCIEEQIEGELNCTRGCDKDYDCPGTQKCCNTGCERQCSSVYPTPEPTPPQLTCLTAKCVVDFVCRHIVDSLQSPFLPQCIPTSNLPKNIDSKCQSGGYNDAILIQSATNSTSYRPLLCGGPAHVSTNTCPSDSVCVGRGYGRGHCCKGAFEPQPS